MGSVTDRMSLRWEWSGGKELPDRLWIAIRGPGCPQGGYVGYWKKEGVHGGRGAESAAGFPPKLASSFASPYNTLASYLGWPSFGARILSTSVWGR